MRRVLQTLLLFFAFVIVVFLLGAIVQGEMLAALLAGLIAVSLVWTALCVPNARDNATSQINQERSTARNFAIRDIGWLTIVCAMGCGWWVDRTAKELQRNVALAPDHVREWLLHRDQDREIYVTEHLRHDLVRTPIWQVWQRTGTFGSWKPLFTIECAWDSRGPGVPTIRKDEDQLVVTDAKGHYEYDLEKARFLSGDNRDYSVYPGCYRSTLPPRP